MRSALIGMPRSRRCVVRIGFVAGVLLRVRKLRMFLSVGAHLELPPATGRN
jgi:hypothetical protein